MKRGVLLLLAAAIICAAVPAFAGESKYFSGESYVLKQNETVDGDLFVFSNSIRIEGKVIGEAFLLGRDVIVSGDVTGDAFVIGDSVKLSGHLSADTRVLGNTLELPGTFDGEVSAAGRNVDLAGTIAGVVNAKGKTVNASGVFGDRVRLRGRSVVLLPSARFDKDVDVTAEEFNKADSVVIKGSLNQIIGKELAHEKKKEGARGWWVLLAFWFVTLCGIIIVGLILRALFPGFVGKATEMVYHHPLHDLGWGVLTIVLMPIILLILIVTLIGIPLALLLLLAFIVGLYLGKLFVAVAVGGFLISRFSTKETHFWTRLVLGAVIVYLVLAIPLIGFFIAILVLCLGIGAIVNLWVVSRKRPQAARASKAPAARRAKK